MRTRPYIGFWDFSCVSQVPELLRHVPKDPKRSIMIGMHLNPKAMLTRHTGADPTDKIKNYFVGDPRLFNLIHFSSPTIDAFPSQIIPLISIGGYNLGGVEFDTPWPSPKTLHQFKAYSFRPVETILSVDEAALRAIEYDGRRLAELLISYQGLVQSFMLRSSTLSLDEVAEILTHYCWTCVALGCTVQPGYAVQAKNIGEVEDKLLKDFPEINLEIGFPPDTVLSPRIDPVRKFFETARTHHLW